MRFKIAARIILFIAVAFASLKVSLAGADDVQANTPQHDIVWVDTSKVPLPVGQLMPRIFWVDNRTLLYAAEKILSPADFHKPDVLDLITVDINTSTFKVVGKTALAPRLCYDTPTKSIVFWRLGSDRKTNGILKYGTFGKALKEVEYSLQAPIKDRPFINDMDCSLSKALPPEKQAGTELLKSGDGYIQRIPDPARLGASMPGEYILHKNGLEKKITTDQKHALYFHRDAATNTYWQSETEDDGHIKVWRFDTSLNLIDVTNYSSGPWGVGRPDSVFLISSKAGFVVPGRLKMGMTAHPTSDRDGLFLAKSDGNNEVMMVGNSYGLSVSPDGCHVAFIQNATPEVSLRQAILKLGVIEVCSSH